MCLQLTCLDCKKDIVTPRRKGPYKPCDLRDRQGYVSEGERRCKFIERRMPKLDGSEGVTLCMDCSNAKKTRVAEEAAAEKKRVNDKHDRLAKQRQDMYQKDANQTRKTEKERGLAIELAREAKRKEDYERYMRDEAAARASFNQNLMKQNPGLGQPGVNNQASASGQNCKGNLTTNTLMSNFSTDQGHNQPALATTNAGDNRNYQHGRQQSNVQVQTARQPTAIEQYEQKMPGHLDALNRAANNSTLQYNAWVRHWQTYQTLMDAVVSAEAIEKPWVGDQCMLDFYNQEEVLRPPEIAAWHAYWDPRLNHRGPNVRTRHGEQIFPAGAPLELRPHGVWELVRLSERQNQAQQRVLPSQTHLMPGEFNQARDNRAMQALHPAGRAGPANLMKPSTPGPATNRMNPATQGPAPYEGDTILRSVEAPPVNPQANPQANPRPNPANHQMIRQQLHQIIDSLDPVPLSLVKATVEFQADPYGQHEYAYEIVGGEQARVAKAVLHSATNSMHVVQLGWLRSMIFAKMRETGHQMQQTAPTGGHRRRRRSSSPPAAPRAAPVPRHLQFSDDPYKEEVFSPPPSPKGPPMNISGLLNNVFKKENK